MPEVVLIGETAHVFEKALSVMRRDGCSRSRLVFINKNESRMHVPLGRAEKLVFLADLIAKIDFKRKQAIKQKKPKTVLKTKKPRAKKIPCGPGTKSANRKRRQEIAAQRHGK